ncbi:MAG: pyridoxamine 5'-phosphate oxidase family protein [Cyanobacteria bacterium J069]|nr:MAG: pyridoxamine 5'-phosphate oxidase family protein [Cyanobacteria bacterium J069]
MLDIDDMSKKEMMNLLRQAGHGHLGCALDGQPYVVPIHYYFDEPAIYIFTTMGVKAKYMDVNPEVCLQVEEMQDLKHWRSATVTGRAEQITDESEIDRVMELVKAQNPALSLTVNHSWRDAWGRTEVMALYRIYARELTGRTASGLSSEPSKASR